RRIRCLHARVPAAINTPVRAATGQGARLARLEEPDVHSVADGVPADSPLEVGAHLVREALPLTRIRSPSVQRLVPLRHVPGRGHDRDLRLDACGPQGVDLLIHLAVALLLDPSVDGVDADVLRALPTHVRDEAVARRARDLQGGVVLEAEGGRGWRLPAGHQRLITI